MRTTCLPTISRGIPGSKSKGGGYPPLFRFYVRIHPAGHKHPYPHPHPVMMLCYSQFVLGRVRVCPGRGPWGSDAAGSVGSCWCWIHPSIAAEPRASRTYTCASSTKNNAKSFISNNVPILSSSLSLSSGGSRISKVGANCKSERVNLLFGQISPENCMKLKEFGPGGAHVTGAP